MRLNGPTNTLLYSSQHKNKEQTIKGKKTSKKTLKLRKLQAKNYRIDLKSIQVVRGTDLM